jgi:hypothetical protein
MWINEWRIAVCLRPPATMGTDRVLNTLAHDLVHVRDFNRMYGCVPRMALGADPWLSRWWGFARDPMNEASVGNLAFELTERYLEEPARRRRDSR